MDQDVYVNVFGVDLYYTYDGRTYNTINLIRAYWPGPGNVRQECNCVAYGSGVQTSLDGLSTYNIYLIFDNTNQLTRKSDRLIVQYSLSLAHGI